jgi:hypothetical protein
MNNVSAIACIGIVGSLLQLFPIPAYADPCADYKLELSRGYVYNCGQQYKKMVVDDPTGTPLNVRDAPNGTINRTLTNGTVIWKNVTRSNKEFGYNSQWVYVGNMYCDFTCFITRGVVYAPYLVPADP